MQSPVYHQAKTDQVPFDRLDAMRKMFGFGPGGVVSADIPVVDHENEVAFYSSVLSTGNTPLWREDLMNNLGQPIIGLGERVPEYENIPMQWAPHFQVADIAASVERAVALGGRDLLHAKDDNGQSLWAGLEDPSGAAFGLIPPVSAESDDPEEPFGCISWISLHASDPGQSRVFYEQVLGWESQTAETDGERGDCSSFEMMAKGGAAAAEINASETDIPPVWLIHLPVADYAESLRRVSEKGGEVVHHDESYAVVKDPIGVHFAITKV